MTDQELIQALRCCAEGECKGCAVYADKQSCQENILARAADRLEGWIKAYEEGRIVVLPCKVGDTVYRVFTVNGREPVIQATKIKTIGQAADLIGRVGKLNKLVSVFRTREEAEKALEAKLDG